MKPSHLDGNPKHVLRGSHHLTKITIAKANQPTLNFFHNPQTTAINQSYKYCTSTSKRQLNRTSITSDFVENQQPDYGLSSKYAAGDSYRRGAYRSRPRRRYRMTSDSTRRSHLRMIRIHGQGARPHILRNMVFPQDMRPVTLTAGAARAILPAACTPRFRTTHVTRTSE